jgi:hypothetical protein
LTLEYLERNFYADVLKKFSAADFKKAGYAPRVHERFQALAKQEASHVQFLEAALGTNAVSDCTYVSPGCSEALHRAPPRVLDIDRPSIAAATSSASLQSRPSFRLHASLKTSELLRVSDC